MSKIPDISQLSFADLRVLSSAVNQRMAELQEHEKHRLAAEWRKKAAEIGVQPEEVLQAMKKTKRRKVPPKYHNPEDPSQTWAGRGKKPRWVIKHLEAGGTVEDLRIDGS